MERKNVELGVGVFLLIGLSCLAYVSLKLGDISLWSGSSYDVHARFSSVSGLKEKSTVTMAGVQIGQVRRIGLRDGQAFITLSIDKDVKLEEDSMASIKTMGLIGDKYVSISPGGSDVYIEPGGILHDTQPPMDIESLLGRFVFGSMDKGEGQEQDSGKKQ